jgi:hypothetical protein
MRQHVRSWQKADFASSSQHVREGQRVIDLEAEIDALRRQAVALGAEPIAVGLARSEDRCRHERAA